MFRFKKLLFLLACVVFFTIFQYRKSSKIFLKSNRPSKNCFGAHGFNECLSDEISLTRNIPDLRTNYCKSTVENASENMPKTSIIMTFHNEAWSTLLRSIHSILNRSPEHLIEEILLIDDFSDMGESSNVL